MKMMRNKEKMKMNQKMMRMYRNKEGLLRTEIMIIRIRKEARVLL